MQSVLSPASDCFKVAEGKRERERCYEAGKNGGSEEEVQREDKINGVPGYLLQGNK